MTRNPHATRWALDCHPTAWPGVYAVRYAEPRGWYGYAIAQAEWDVDGAVVVQAEWSHLPGAIADDLRDAVYDLECERNRVECGAGPGRVVVR